MLPLAPAGSPPAPGESIAMAEGLKVHTEETCSASFDGVTVTEQADYL